MALRKEFPCGIIVHFKEEFANVFPNWEKETRESAVLYHAKGLEYLHNDSGPSMVSKFFRRPGKEGVAKTEEEIQAALSTPSEWPELLKYQEIEFSLNGHQYTDLEEWRREAHTEVFNQDFFDRLKDETTTSTSDK